MLDSNNTSQTDHNASTAALLASDYELNGTVNRAASEGAKFALILAMLEQDCTHRPNIDKPKESERISKWEDEHNYYRSSPLSVSDTYWQTSQVTSQLIHNGQLDSAKLWLAMHPEPLSQHNNADTIDETVIANCGVNTQNRLNQVEQLSLNVDETGLYDILQQLEPAVT